MDSREWTAFDFDARQEEEILGDINTFVLSLRESRASEYAAPVPPLPKLLLKSVEREGGGYWGGDRPLGVAPPTPAARRSPSMVSSPVLGTPVKNARFWRDSLSLIRPSVPTILE